MDEALREKRRRAGRAGGAATAARRSRGAPVAGPAPAPETDDGLVYGTAAQLREHAAALTARDTRTAGPLAAAGRARVQVFRSRHPQADLTSLAAGRRPICETAVAERPAGERAGLRVVNNGDGPADLYIDDVITYPDDWFGGISFRDIREALADLDGQDVVVHFNSPGGDVFEGVAIYQAFRDYPGDVYGAVDSLAASIASVIAMGADTVGIGTLAMMMIHEASGFAHGNAADMLAMAGLLEQVSGTLASAYANKVPDTTAKYWRDLMLAETWIGADYALELGLADERLNPDDADPDDTGAGGPEDRAAFLGGLTAAYQRPAPTTGPTPADVRLSILNGLKEARSNG